MRWIEGAERRCIKCGVEIKNLSQQTGVVRTIFPGNKRQIICMSCHVGPARRRLGLEDPEAREGS